ncbi:unnamed protein product [Schistosoma turkestanicum]|nr:unnamed protein product [Schistosoma turkestanicum]
MFDGDTNDQNIRMANRLVANHMKTHGYDYSLSVFVPETGLTSFELEEFTKDTSSFMPCVLSSDSGKQTSFHKEYYSLLVLILKAYREMSSIPKENKAVQVVETNDPNLDYRLNSINKEYEAVRSSEILHMKKTFDDRLEQYRNEMNERSRIEIEQQMLEFRQNELNLLKSELEEEFQRRLHQNIQQLQEEFEFRCQSLNEKELLLRDKHNLLKQKEEREAFVRRQALQAELDAVQLVKSQLDQEKLQMDNDKMQLQKDYEKNELEFKKRENLLEIREKTLESEIHEHVNRIRMEDEIKLLKQRKELELQTVQLSENQKVLEEKLKTVELLKQELVKQQNKFTEMEIVDYDTIKTQNELFKAEVSSLKKQLKSAVIELEEQKQIAASATTELGVLKVVKQEMEKLINTLNNDHAAFVQEKFTLQKKLNEQQNEIYRLMERLALCEGENKLNHAQNIEASFANYSSKQDQNPNNPQLLTEAERRSIYKECNLSISSDLSHESMIDANKHGKSCIKSTQLSIDPNSNDWLKRLELSRRRMAQLRLVNEEFDSIYEEWKSVDLKEFLSKINCDLPTFLNEHKLDQLINLNDVNLSNHLFMTNNNTESDHVKHHCELDQQAEMHPCHDNEHLTSATKLNPESKNMKTESEQMNHNAQLHFNASIIRDRPVSSSSIDTPKSNKLALKETLSISSHKPIKSSSTITHHSFKKKPSDHLAINKSDVEHSTESIFEAESTENRTSRNSQTNSFASDISYRSVSNRFDTNNDDDDDRNKSVHSEHNNHAKEEQEESINSKKANFNDKIANNYTGDNVDNTDSIKKKNHDTIENGFPLLLETSRYDRVGDSLKQCSFGNNDRNKPISNGSISPTIHNTTMKKTECNGLMEKYLKLSLNANSKSPVPTTYNHALNESKVANGFHSPNHSKDNGLLFENGHHFSSSESDIISLNNDKTKCHNSPGNFNNDEVIPNDIDIDNNSDYVW